MTLHLTKSEYKKELISYFEKVSKMTIKEAVLKIKKEMSRDKYGNLENDTISALNVHVMYIENEKFSKGKGFFITSKGNFIKLTNYKK